MASGGPRPGSGRKKGAVAVSVAIPPSARAAVTDALVERIKDIDLSPIEVMLRGMKYHYDESRVAMSTSDHDTAKAELSASMAYAKEVAPYIHPRLQATTLKGDKENPLELALGLASIDDLRKAVRGK